MSSGNPTTKAPTAGLEDHSEELSERTEAEAQIRFYRSMAEVAATDSRLPQRLARTVAEVLYDFCVVYRCTPGLETIDARAVFHPNDHFVEALNKTFVDGKRPLARGLVEHVLQRQESYFRPRWSPHLLAAHGDDSSQSLPLDIDIHSLLVIPLIGTDDQPLGALLVGRHTTSLSFDETDLALSEWIASHAAMKLETARLYSDLKETNQQLDAALEARDNFIAVAAHQLRSPLGTLKLQAEMMRRSIGSELADQSITPSTIERLLERVDDTDRQVDYIDRIVDQLLHASKFVDGAHKITPEPCDLHLISEEVARRFSHLLQRQNCSLTIRSPGSLTGEWDRDCLDHVVANLLSNAIKYGANSPITLTLQRHQQSALLSVQDQGPGIDPDDQQRIFQRFERANRRQKGLGLGLWIVRQYVEAHQGNIEIDSTPGEGSTFRVQLPLSS